MDLVGILMDSIRSMKMVGRVLEKRLCIIVTVDEMQGLFEKGRCTLMFEVGCWC